jgi:ergothioneine biosynthesis protein EgtB
MKTDATATAERPDLLAQRFSAVRALTRALAAPLSDADASVQSMPDASPAKWHLAHTSWFFEAFVLRPHVPGYRPFDERFAYLFNSYYEAEGARQPRHLRGLITRPTLDAVLSYRAHVDAAVEAAFGRLDANARDLIELGTHHEEQHQELLLTDILHLFAQNPLQPAMWEPEVAAGAAASPLGWMSHDGGIVRIGNDGRGFAFDCEGPVHDVLLRPYALASRPVSAGEWLAFIEDGGYATPSLWLSDGWAWVQRERIEAPLHWERRDDGWTSFTLGGRTAIDPTAPVAHVSYYEADAFATWAGARLPTEFEWEAAAREHDPAQGVFLDRAGPVAPQGGTAVNALFGNVWQWTASAYLPYPGFRTAPGAVGEYNGKFMCGQFVLKGGSCATPRGHVRAAYRNFFPPHQRWQFAGLRLAKDVA